MYIFEIVAFFSGLVVIQSTQFFSGSTYLQHSRFDEAFSLLTVRIPMVTKLSRVMTCYEELQPINIMTTQRNGFLGSRDKKIYLNLQKIYRHHTRQGVDLA